MADDEKPPKDKVRTLPAKPVIRGVPSRRKVDKLAKWWLLATEDTPGATTLADAMRDVGILSLAVLAKQLVDPKTSEAKKRQIALVMGPKLAVQIVGKGGLREPPPGEQGARGILDGYRGEKG